MPYSALRHDCLYEDLHAGQKLCNLLQLKLILHNLLRPAVHQCPQGPNSACQARASGAATAAAEDTFPHRSGRRIAQDCAARSGSLPNQKHPEHRALSASISENQQCQLQGLANCLSEGRHRTSEAARAGQDAPENDLTAFRLGVKGVKSKRAG